MIVIMNGGMMTLPLEIEQIKQGESSSQSLMLFSVASLAQSVMRLEV